MDARFVVALLAAMGVAACGSSPSSPSPTPTPTPSGSTIVASGENWSCRLDGLLSAPTHNLSGIGLFILPTYGSSAPLVALEGAFNTTAGSVIAVLQPYGRCFDWDTNRDRFTGARLGNTIALESLPDASQVIRINVMVSDSGDTAQGTYTITGGCGGGSSGSINGRRVNLTGVWTGTMGSIPVRLDMVMANAPESNGSFGVSGTATFSGTSCFPNAMITRVAKGRIAFPDIVGPPHHMELVLELWEDLTAMNVAYGLTE